MKRSIAALSLVVLVGCSGGDGGIAVAATTTSTSTTTITTTTKPAATTTAKLRPADEVQAEIEAERTVTHKLGDLFDVGNGIFLKVANPRPGGDDGGPWTVVDVRVENRSVEPLSVPNIGIVCGTSEMGGTQADATLETGGDLAPSSFAEGTVHLLAPEDGRYGEPVPPCVGAKRIRIETVISMDTDPIHEITLDG